MFLTNLWSNPFDNAIEIAFSSFFESLPSFFKGLIVAFTNLGDNLIILIILGLFFVMFKKTRFLGIGCFVGLAFSLLLEFGIKDIFDRTRPFNDPDLVSQLISIQNNGGVPYGEVPSSSSFPSGHTFGAFTIFGTSTFCLIHKKDEKKFYLKTTIFFGIFAVLMGFSRVLVSHHYFTDVLAGGALGFIFGIAGYYIIVYSPKLYNLIVTKIKEKKSHEETSNTEE